MRLNETDCRFDVVGLGGKFAVRREAIIDAEPSESCVGQGLEDIRDGLLLIARYPPSAVYQHSRRKRATSSWNICIQCKANTVNLRIPRDLHNFEHSRSSREVKGQANQDATTNTSCLHSHLDFGQAEIGHH